jgi:hypothetical protein
MMSNPSCGALVKQKKNHLSSKQAMKFKIILLAGLAALGFASSANAQTVYNITGATAFRSAAQSAIISLLGGASTEYAYVSATTLSSATHAVFKGSIAGTPTIVRCNWSGSTQGIADVINAANIVFLRDELVSPDVSTSGVLIAASIGAATTAGKTETAVARFSFSDVSQDISNTPSPPLPGVGVGVVPFVFVANVGAPAGLTNMTDQLHEAQWANGQLPLSMYTGNPADTKLVLNTGRNNGSGTRATILAETQYGPFKPVVQWGGPNDATNVTGGEGSDGIGTGAGTVATLTNLGNSGYSNNSFVRQNLARTSTNVTVAGTAGQDVVIVSYLTLSDAAAITDVTGGVGKGAKDLTYNGVPYTEANVKNGSYTLWGYQQFYGAADITTPEQTFFNALVAAIQPILNPLSNGIRETDMNVTRDGGDGGIITPGNN